METTKIEMTKKDKLYSLLSKAPQTLDELLAKAGFNEHNSGRYYRQSAQKVLLDLCREGHALKTPDRTYVAVQKTAERTPRRPLSRKIARRIMERCANGEKAIVLIVREGQPSSVYGFREYLEKRRLPNKVKPWTYRKSPARPSDALPSINAGILMPLKRENYYDE